jgi:cysteine desulfurase
VNLYFDHGATTPLRPEVLDAMMESLRSTPANPGSLHDPGQQSRAAVEHAREQVAAAIGASPREIIFTASGTEANNLALLGAARKHKNRGSHILVSQVEHPSVLHTCRALEQEGFRVTYLPVTEQGELRMEELEAALTPDTILVSVMAANNETGTLMPIADIGRLLKGTGILFHTDAVQWFGKKPLDVQTWQVDLMSLGGHKINGPKGVGVLYLRKGTRIDPILYGGGQERGLRPGTANVPAIAGMGVAAHLADREAAATESRLTHLRDRLWRRLSETIPGVRLNGHPTLRLPSHLNISFEQVEGQAVLLELNRHGISVSSGSACSAGKHAPSHVLTAMGRPPEEAYQSVRITLGKSTTEEEVDLLAEKCKEVVDYLRSLMETT